MSNDQFDQALVSAAFGIIGERGWTSCTVAAAARRADLPLARARTRFGSRHAILARFGEQTDRAALADPIPNDTHRAQLFDLLMRRFDHLQAHRAGVLALLDALPTDPGTALFLHLSGLRSMGWMLGAAGIEGGGWRGGVRMHGLLAVWLQAVRVWRRDESGDLADTMAALDRAMERAERFAGWLGQEKTHDGDPQDLPGGVTVLDVRPDLHEPPTIIP